MKIKRSPQQAYSRLRLLPCNALVCGVILLILMYIVGFQLSRQLAHDSPADSSVMQMASAGFLRKTSTDVATSSGVGVSSIIRGGVTSCVDAKNKVKTGEWADPNIGRIYARETESSPHFRISLHDKEYDPVRWRIMEEGRYYEEEVHRRFVEILSNYPGPSYVVDVGANIGYYTLLSAALGHYVVSFEPNPANILRLCDSLRLNDWSWNSNVNIFQNAVSSNDVHGDEMMLHAPKNPGQGFLKPIDPAQDTENDAHKAKTTLVSLDKFSEEQGWFDNGRKDFSIPLLKVDVEGKDPQVILGAKRLLESGLVKNVLTECRRFGRPNVLEMFVVLLDAGFTLKEPTNVPTPGSNTKEKAAAIRDWYLNKLGKGSQENQDMWWAKTS